VDALHGRIVTYLGQLSQESMGSRESDQLGEYMAAANHIENIGDMVETNLVEAGSERLRNQVEMSSETQQLLTALHQKVCWSVDNAVLALRQSDHQLAEEVMAAKLDINRLASEAEEHLAHRLTADEPNRLATFRIEIEIIEYLKRVYYFAKRIAKITSDADLVYRQVVLNPVAEEAALG
jgi:phosphate:Na+ symporter